jgi:TatD DNase family protein
MGATRCWAEVGLAASLRQFVSAIANDKITLQRNPETDYPARQTRAKLPGAVSPLEQRLSRLRGLPEPEVRHRLWANLKAIAITSGALDGFSDELADKLLAA